VADRDGLAAVAHDISAVLDRFRRLAVAGCPRVLALQ